MSSNVRTDYGLNPQLDTWHRLVIRRPRDADGTKPERQATKHDRAENTGLHPPSRPRDRSGSTGLKKVPSGHHRIRTRRVSERAKSPRTGWRRRDATGTASAWRVESDARAGPSKGPNWYRFNVVWRYGRAFTRWWAVSARVDCRQASPADLSRSKGSVTR